MHPDLLKYLAETSRHLSFSSIDVKNENLRFILRDISNRLFNLARSEPGTADDDIVGWETPKDRARVLKLARELWDKDEHSCAWSDENREHYIIRAAMMLGNGPTELMWDTDSTEKLVGKLKEIAPKLDEKHADVLSDACWWLRVLSEAHLPSLKVRRLKWEWKEAQDYWMAQTEIGTYIAWCSNMKANFSFNPAVNSPTFVGSNVEHAKSAAQKDYESRILASIDASARD